MTTFIANHSTYPRIGDRLEQQRLRRAVDRWEEKEISDGDLEGVLREATAEVVSEQNRAGLDLVTDGGLRRYDPISQWLKEFKGVRLGRLLRFLDTNTSAIACPIRLASLATASKSAALTTPSFSKISFNLSSGI